MDLGGRAEAKFSAAAHCGVSIRFHHRIAATTMTRITPFFLAAAVAFPLLAGCGGGSGVSLGQVSGTVTFDGKPASGIQVSFMPADGGRPSTATTDSSGKYELIFSPTEKGALVGAHEVSIAAAEPEVGTESTGGESLQSAGIPAEYRQSKKTVEVKAGRNTIDLTYP